MPGIRRPTYWNSKVSYHIPRGHDPYPSDPDPSHLRYCQSCLHVGVKSELKRRLYRVESLDNGNGNKLVPETVPAPDADRFRQCYRCGDIVPMYNVKYEAKIEDFVQTIDNPFDTNPGNMEGFTPGIGKSSRLNKSKSIYKRRKQYINSIKDEDIRRELADGQTQLFSYMEL